MARWNVALLVTVGGRAAQHGVERHKKIGSSYLFQQVLQSGCSLFGLPFLTQLSFGTKQPQSKHRFSMSPPFVRPNPTVEPTILSVVINLAHLMPGATSIALIDTVVSVNFRNPSDSDLSSVIAAHLCVMRHDAGQNTSSVLLSISPGQSHLTHLTAVTFSLLNCESISSHMCSQKFQSSIRASLVFIAAHLCVMLHV